MCHLTASNSPRELSDAATARRQTAAARHDAARHAARHADAAAGRPAAAGHDADNVNNVLRTHEERSGLDAPSGRQTNPCTFRQHHSGPQLTTPVLRIGARAGLPLACDWPSMRTTPACEPSSARVGCTCAAASLLIRVVCALSSCVAVDACGRGELGGRSCVLCGGHTRGRRGHAPVSPAAALHACLAPARR